MRAVGAALAGWPAWATLFVAVGAGSLVVWRVTVGRRGAVDREHVSRAAADLRDAYVDDAAAPAYDVPLSYDEARRIAGALSVLADMAEQGEAAENWPVTVSEARLFAELLDRRLAAPRSIGDV